MEATRALAQRLRVGFNPSLLAAVSLGNVSMAAVASVIYHDDLTSLFAKLDQVRAGFERGRNILANSTRSPRRSLLQPELW